MSREDVKRALFVEHRLAGRFAARARDLCESGELTRAELCADLRAYILCKYRLSEREARGIESLERLAEQSLEKMEREFPELAAEESRSATCDAASSTDNKQALLMVAIQKDFEVELDGFEVAFAETVDDLAAIMWRCYEEGESPSPTREHASGDAGPAATGPASEMQSVQDEILADLHELPDSLSRYTYLIECGRELGDSPVDLRDDAYLVRDCAVNTWIRAGCRDGRAVIEGDSESFIVCGAIALIEEIYNGRTRQEVASFQCRLLDDELFAGHFSFKQREGLASAIGQIEDRILA